MKNRALKSSRNKYVRLSTPGSEFNLCFSSHMSVGNKIVAFDGVRKTLLITDDSDALNEPIIIDLSQIKSVSVSKSYGSINSGELKKKKFDEFLQTIDLRFEYAARDEEFILTFYTSNTDSVDRLPVLERKARNWQMILSNLLSWHPGLVKAAAARMPIG